MSVRLASFDIFDTVLIRKCGKPENVFWIMAYRLFPEDIEMQSKFVNWRISVFVNFPYNSNYSIDDIYDNRCDKLFSQYSSDYLKQIEIDVESDMLISNADAIKIIKNSRESGYKIAFISDMYLSSDFLREILYREGILRKEDLVFVSNECCARKDTGVLFDYVKNKINPVKWVHYGDNKRSDFDIPRSKGINAKLVNMEYHPSELYQMSMSNILPSTAELSILAGISRAARNKYGNGSEVILAAEYVAPVLISYVRYIISNAQQKGIKTLFFVARDGYILMKIAEVLPHDGIQLNFLFLSRRSLRLPYLFGSCKEDFLNMFPSQSIINKTIKELSNIIMVDIDLEIEQIKTKSDEDDFLRIIYSEPIYSQWQRIAKEQYDILYKYLCQEGVMEDNIALVDVGWYGSTRMMINSIRSRNEKSQCVCYYWGLNVGALSEKYGPYYCFLKNINSSVWSNIWSNVWTVWIMEDYFLACIYPSTIGYKEKDRKVYPLFERNKNMDDIVRVCECNTMVIRYIVELMSKFNLSEAALYSWCFSSLYSMNTFSYYVDYTPFYKICKREDDDTKLYCLKKFTLKDVVRYIKGCRISTNDIVCLDFTYGFRKRCIITMLRHIYAKFS